MLKGEFPSSGSIKKNPDKCVLRAMMGVAKYASICKVDPKTVPLLVDASIDSYAFLGYRIDWIEEQSLFSLAMVMFLSVSAFGFLDNLELVQ